MLRAIETRYSGYRFRSRLEARWAVFLDKAEIRYEYEKEGFHLSSGMYLPDFWLPDYETWLEIKPEGEECKHAAALRDEGNHPVVVSNGGPDNVLSLFCWDLGDSSGGSSQWLGVWVVDRYTGHISIGVCALGKEICKNSMMEPWGLVTDFENLDSSLTFQGMKLVRARIAAKEARFEHGTRLEGGE